MALLKARRFGARMGRPLCTCTRVEWEPESPRRSARCSSSLARAPEHLSTSPFGAPAPETLVIERPRVCGKHSRGDPTCVHHERAQARPASTPARAPAARDRAASTAHAAGGLDEHAHRIDGRIGRVCSRSSSTACAAFGSRIGAGSCSVRECTAWWAHEVGHVAPRSGALQASTTARTTAPARTTTVSRPSMGYHLRAPLNGTSSTTYQGTRIPRARARQVAITEASTLGPARRQTRRACGCPTW
jgi:hypothetical protein